MAALLVLTTGAFASPDETGTELPDDVVEALLADAAAAEAAAETPAESPSEGPPAEDPGTTPEPAPVEDAPEPEVVEETPAPPADEGEAPAGPAEEAPATVVSPDVGATTDDGQSDGSEDASTAGAEAPASGPSIGLLSLSPLATGSFELGTISARVGSLSQDNSRCLRVGPGNSSGAWSSWVPTSGGQNTAWGAHGRPSGWSSGCPSDVDTDRQSAVGVSPAPGGSVAPGTPFLIGAITHSNNPIAGGSGSGQTRLHGTVEIRLDGFAGQPVLSYPWTLWETTNNANPCADGNPNRQGVNDNGCADRITFTDTDGNRVLTDADGLTYNLTIAGMQTTSTGSCPASPSGNVQNVFWTREDAVSIACVYGSLDQTRPLTIVKEVEGAAQQDTPSFPFTSTSTHASSPYAGGSFSLRPTPATPSPQYVGDVYVGSTVSVSEILPPEWDLRDAVCVAGGQTVDFASVSDQTLILADIPTATSPADRAITCTFTNVPPVEYDDLVVSKSVEESFARDYSWSLVKTVDPESVTVPSTQEEYEAGYTLTVTPSAPTDSDFVVAGMITVTNPNDVPFTGVDVTDVMPGATCTVTGGIGLTVPADGSIGVPYTCVLTGATATSTGTNTAGATWDASAYRGTTGTATVEEGYDFAGAEIEVTNETAVLTDSEAGADVIGITNPLHAGDGQQVSEYDLAWPVEAGECVSYPNTATLAPSDTGALTDAAVIEICGSSDLAITKTTVMTYGMSYDWDLTKTGVTVRTDADGATWADFEIAVTAGEGTAGRWTMSGEVEVTNPNEFVDISATVTDVPSLGVLAGAACTVARGTDVTVPAGATISLTYACTFTGTPLLTGTNTATVTWDAEEYGTPTGEASHKIDVVAQNTLTPINETVTVWDDEGGTYAPGTQIGAVTWTAPGDVTTIEHSVQFSAGPGECQTIVDTAWLGELDVSDWDDLTWCNELPLTVTKTAEAHYDASYAWSIVKTATGVTPLEDGTGYVSDYTITVTPGEETLSGWTVTGQITVTNPNRAGDLQADPVTFTVTDQLSSGESCTVDGGTSVTLAPGESVTLNYTCELGDDYEPVEEVTNAATVTPVDGEAVTSDPVPVDFERDLVEHETVTVVDDIGTEDESDDVELTADTGPVPWNAQGTPTVFEHSITRAVEEGFCDTVTNRATIVETDQSDTATAEWCNELALDVTKTAEGAYDAAYAWDIVKTADGVTPLEDGTGYVSDYTITVTPGEETRTGWTVTGQITVTNPNSQGDSVTFIVTDELSTGETCTVVGGEPVTLAPGASITLDYTCDLGDDYEPADEVTNTVNLTVDGDLVGTATAAVTFARAAVTDETVTVVDDNGTEDEADDVLLGEVSWDEQAGEPAAFEHSITRLVEEGFCDTVTNRATIVETDQSDTATAWWCNELPLTVSKSAEGAYDAAYAWSIVKTATGVTPLEDGTGYVSDYTITLTQGEETLSGWTVTGQITVSNPNRAGDLQTDPVTFTVTDQLSDSNACTVDGGTSVTLAPGETIVLDYTCELGDDYEPVEDLANTATVTPVDGEAVTSAPVAVTFTEATVTDRTVNLVDDNGTPADDADDVPYGPVTWSAEGTETVFEHSITRVVQEGFCDTVTNRATIVETDQSDTATAEWCNEAPLTVTKTAEGSYDSTFAWSIVKTADGVEATDDGYVSDYTITVTPGAETLTGWTVTGQITVTNPNRAGDVEADPVTFTVTDQLSSSEECVVTGGESVTLAPGASITLDYTCDLGDDYEPADEVTNTVSLTVDGDVVGTDTVPVDFEVGTQTYRTVNVVDDNGTPDDESDDVELGVVHWNAAGTPRVFEHSITRSVEEGFCDTVTNRATIVETDQSDTATAWWCNELPLTVSKSAEAHYDASYAWDIVKTADGVTPLEDGTGYVSDYTITVTPGAETRSGYAVTGQITVTNPNRAGDLQADPVTFTVTDQLSSSEECVVTGGESVTLAPGESVTLDYTCDLGDDYEPADEVTNTVTLVEDSDEAPVIGTATAAVTFARAAVTDETVTVVDDNGTEDEADDVLLGEVSWDEQAGEPVAFEHSITRLVEEGFCDQVTNRATIVETEQSDTATAWWCNELPLTVSKSAEAHYDASYAWDIVKTADGVTPLEDGTGYVSDYTITVTPGEETRSGYAVTGAITVTNPNRAGDLQADPVTFTVTDQLSSSEECVVTGGESVTLAPGESVTLDYTCDLGDDYEPADEVTNTVTLVEDSDEAPVIGTATAAVTFARAAVTDETVTVVDDNGTEDEADDVLLGEVSWDERAGEPAAFEHSITRLVEEGFCDQVTNRATIVETEQSDTATAWWCNELPLTVGKTVEASYDSTYLWEIDKTAATTGAERVDYEITLTQGEEIRSGYVVTGTITVANPNHNADLQADAVAFEIVDELSSGEQCTVLGEDGGAAVGILHPGEELTFTYVCDLGDDYVPADEPANTVTVYLAEETEGAEPEVITEVTVPVEFVRDAVTNETVTVVDDNATPDDTSDDRTFGPVTWEAEGTVSTFTYSQDVTVPAGECLALTNTAEIAETGQDATADARLCAPQPPTPPAPPTPPTPPRPDLPVTGADVAMIGFVAAGLVVAGGAVALGVRRRRS